jgi:hypothetical protein
MRELNPNQSALLMNKINHLHKSQRLLFVPNSRTASGDSALRTNCSGLNHYQPHASGSKSAKMDQVPSADNPILC